MTRSSLEPCLADLTRAELLNLFERSDELERGAPRHLVPGALPGEVAPVRTLTPESRRVLHSLAALRKAGHGGDDLVVAWVGAATADLHAWLEAASILGFTLRMAVPDGHEPDAGLFLACEGRSPGRLIRSRDEAAARARADVVLTPDAPEVPATGSAAGPSLDAAIDEALARLNRGGVDFRALMGAVPPPTA